MRHDEMRLDGNSAGGALTELFARDMTAAQATCASCGACRAFAELLDYGGSMGVILRCPGCGAAMLRMVHARGCLRVDVSGLAFLIVDDAGDATA